MAISLCSALALVALLQAPPPPPPPADSLATLRGRATQDSTDAQMWLLMGRTYLGLGVEAHGATHRSSEDSAWTRAVLDTAEEALARAAALAGPLGSSAVGDRDRKSTRLNSSHGYISYAVFCLKKKKQAKHARLE